MNVIVIVAIIIALVVLIPVIIYVRNNYIHDTPEFIYSKLPSDKYLFSNVVDKFKTGDLLLFRASSITSTFLFNPSILYKHIGLIYESNEQLYLIEMTTSTPYGIDSNRKILQLNNGLNIIPLFSRLQNYIGIITWIKLNKKLNESQLKKLQDLKDTNFNNITFPPLVKLYIHYMYNINLEENLMFCYKFIYYLLQELEILNKYNLSLSNIIRFTNEIYNFELNNGYNYDLMGQVIMDVYRKDNELIIL
jgi:hypothetical protein